MPGSTSGNVTRQNVIQPAFAQIARSLLKARIETLHARHQNRDREGHADHDMA